jgi:N-sulfoglucosamine sulfohydrolase
VDGKMHFNMDCNIKNEHMKRTIIILILMCSINMVIAQERTKSDHLKPNFVFILADDCTFRDIGIYGGQAYTPHIDQLAKEGMKFKRAFQTAPMCSPTRHTIYTGLYPVKSGAYPNHTFANDDVKSIVQYLKPMGYRVALSGKSHIAPKSVFPFEYSNAIANYPEGSNSKPKRQNSPDFSAIEKLMSESKENKNPFCLFVTSNQPHAPWDLGDPSRYPPEKLELASYYVDTKVTREELSKYYAEITYFDDEVGRTLALLKKYKLDDNTLVIVTTEQGNQLPFAKWTLYDSGLQTAFIARWPGKIKANTVSDAMIEYVDVLPTFVEAAGGIVEADVDGKSIIPVLLGKKTTHKEEVYGIMTTNGINQGSKCFPIRSIRNSDYKLILNLSPEEKFLNTIQDDTIFLSWVDKAKAGNKDAQDKIHRYNYRPAIELYSIKDDVVEWNNLATDPTYKDVVTNLKYRLEAWMKEQGDLGIETELKAPERQHYQRKVKTK